MSSITDLQDSLESFAQSCNDHAQLGGMIRDWNRVFHITSTDTGEDYTLITEAGRVSVRAEAPRGDIIRPDLTVQATADILTQVFYGELSPNEPYNDGSLRIVGPEDDIVRLDFVIAMLWD